MNIYVKKYKTFRIFILTTQQHCRYKYSYLRMNAHFKPQDKKKKLNACLILTQGIILK